MVTTLIRIQVRLALAQETWTLYKSHDRMDWQLLTQKPILMNKLSYCSYASSNSSIKIKMCTDNLHKRLHSFEEVNPKISSSYACCELSDHFKMSILIWGKSYKSKRHISLQPYLCFQACPSVLNHAKDCLISISLFLAYFANKLTTVFVYTSCCFLGKCCKYFNALLWHML